MLSDPDCATGGGSGLDDVERGCQLGGRLHKVANECRHGVELSGPPTHTQGVQCVPASGRYLRVREAGHEWGAKDKQM